MRRRQTFGALRCAPHTLRLTKFYPFPFRCFLNTIPPIMNLLAIETSSPVLSVALQGPSGKIRQAAVQGFMKHAENLLPSIDKLLKKERLKLSDIDAFLVGRGPGSFTGLRIGFATLKGFLAVSGKPCYGALSLDLIAAEVPGEKQNGGLTVCVDARRSKLYVRSYRYHQGQWRPTGTLQVLPCSEVEGIVPQNHCLTGDGVARFDAGSRSVLPQAFSIPRAAALVKLFNAKSPLIKKLARPKEGLPLYLRHSEPEEKLAEAKKRA